MSEIFVPLIVLVSTFGGVYLGHWLTLKAFAHVQPSTKELTKVFKGGVTMEPDPWEDPPDEQEKEKDVVHGNVQEMIKNATEFYGHDVGVGNLEEQNDN